MKKTYINLGNSIYMFGLLFLFAGSSLFFPVRSMAQMPSCRDLTIGINERGISEVTLEELVNGKPLLPVYITVRSEGQTLIFEGEVEKMSDMLKLELCEYAGESVNVKLQNKDGTCDNVVSVSTPPVPVVRGRKIHVMAGDPLTKEGVLIGDTFPVIESACRPLPQLKAGKDYVQPEPCDDPDHPLQRIIYRELSGTDRWGQRFTANDTIIVYKFPEISAGSILNQKVFPLQCGEAERTGPAFVFENPVSGETDTLPLVKVIKKGNRKLEFEVRKLPEDSQFEMELASVLDNNTKCEKQYKMTLSWRQKCFSAREDTAGSPAPGIKRLGRGDFQVTFDILDRDSIAPVIEIADRFVKNQTGNLDCEARVQFPELRIEDDCSGVRKASASVSGHFTADLKKNSAGLWESKEREVLPAFGKDYYDKAADTLIENAFKVIVEATDSCDLVRRDSFYIQVVDETRPVAIPAGNVRVGLVGQLTWIDVEKFDDGSHDNCGVAMVLGRRIDWTNTAGVEVCDGLETDSRVNPVEAHYAAFLDRLLDDREPCDRWLYEQWMQDSAYYCGGKDAGMDIPQVGGGWTTQIPFTCEDACLDVPIEILVVDASCNWSVMRTTVQVRDEQPVKIIQDLEEEITLNCTSFGNDYIRIVQEASDMNHLPFDNENRKAAFMALNDLLGGYENVWQDLDGQLTSPSGEKIVPSEHKISLHQTQCETFTERKEVEFFDENTGEFSTRFEYLPSVRTTESDFTIKNGIVAVNCSSSVYQDISVRLDACGNGTIRRRFFVAEGCGEVKKGDWLEANEGRIAYTREQVIRIVPDCELSLGMFDLPSSVTALDVCSIEKNANGNFEGDLHPDFTGWPSYQWPETCRDLRIGYEDKLYELVGNNPYGQWKLARKWTMVDECESGDQGGEGIIEYEQIIIINEVSECDSLKNRKIISGLITTPTGDPLPNVNLMVDGLSGNTPRAATSVHGTYSVAALINRNYKITPVKTDQPSRGVSTFDLVLMHRHILGKETLENPYQLLAADVNNNGMVDLGDILELKQAILRPDFQFLNNTSYQFVDQDSGNSFAHVENLKDDVKVNFVGVKVGDVDFSGYKTSGVSSRSSGMRLYMDDLTLVPGKSYRIPVSSEMREYILGLQFEWGLNGRYLNSISLESGQINISSENYALPTGEHLTFSWFDVDEVEIDPEEALFYVNIEVKRKTNLKNLWKTSGDILETESYAEPGVVRGLSFSVKPSAVQGMTAVQNRPNPFREQTVIRYLLDEAGVVTLSVYDMNGRRVLQRKSEGKRGMNEVEVYGEDLPAAGLFYYHLGTARERYTGKMMHIK